MAGWLAAWLSPRVLATLLIPPVYIAVVSLAERRWGQTLSGRLTALPTQTSTIILVVAIEQGLSVAAGVAAGAILGIVSLTAFALAYGLASRRLAWPGSLALGLAGFFAVAGAALTVRGSPPVDAVVATVAVVAVAVALARLPRTLASGDRVTVGLATRMALAMVLVVAVAASVTVLGPVATGVLGVFPIITAPMTTLNHRESGASAARRYLEGLEWGLVGGVAYFLLLSDLLRPDGLALSFALGIPLLVVLQLACYVLPPRLLPRVSGPAGYGPGI